MCLRNYVTNEDIDFSIKLFLESFLQCQKYYIQKFLRKKLSHCLNSEYTIPLLLNIYVQ